MKIVTVKEILKARKDAIVANQFLANLCKLYDKQLKDSGNMLRERGIRQMMHAANGAEDLLNQREIRDWALIHKRP